MREFAKEFYQSKAWKNVRALVFQRDLMCCRRCGAPGEIVHHKTWLTAENISDPDISLNPDNLETLCRTCHALEHEGAQLCEESLRFDADGNIVRIEEWWS